MRAQVWFDLPWINEKDGRKFQTILESHVLQNDRDFILEFLKNLPDVHMYLAENCKPNQEVPAT